MALDLYSLGIYTCPPPMRLYLKHIAHWSIPNNVYVFAVVSVKHKFVRIFCGSCLKLGPVHRMDLNWTIMVIFKMSLSKIHCS